jgi:hypothetical protein
MHLIQVIYYARLSSSFGDAITAGLLVSTLCYPGEDSASCYVRFSRLLHPIYTTDPEPQSPLGELVL